MLTPLPLLKVDVAHIAESCVIRVRGELDLAGCPEFELALEGAERTAAERLVVDLEELEFIDASGLHTLLEAARRSARKGNRLEVTRGSRQVARVMHLSEVASLLPLTDACMCPAIIEGVRGSNPRRVDSATASASGNGARRRSRSGSAINSTRAVIPA